MDQNSHFQNEHTKVTLTRHPGCMVHLEVEMDATRTKQAFDTAVRDVKKEVSIPGFRKGKAPDDVVKTNFASAINKQFRDLVVQDAFREALTLTNLQPFGKQAVKRSEMKKCAVDEGAHVTFNMETEPETPHIDVEAIETEMQAPREVTDKQVERAYKQLRVMHATWQEVQDRPVQDGDFVEIDVDVIQHPAHNVCTNQLVHVDKDELPSWLFEALVGMQIDESKETQAAPKPEDPTHLFVHEENAAPKECRVVVKKIKVAELPQENDDFAKKVGVESVDLLKNALRDRLKHEEAEYANDISRYNLRRELLQKYPFDLPQSLLDAEVRGRFAFCKGAVDTSKGSLPQEQKDAELRTQLEAEARGFFAWMHLLRQFTPELKVGFSEQELQAEFQHQMRLPRIHRLIYPGLAPEEVRNRVFMLLLMRKCEEHLLALREKARTAT